MYRIKLLVYVNNVIGYSSIIFHITHIVYPTENLNRFRCNELNWSDNKSLFCNIFKNDPIDYDRICYIRLTYLCLYCFCYVSQIYFFASYGYDPIKNLYLLFLVTPVIFIYFNIYDLSLSLHIILNNTIYIHLLPLIIYH